MHNEYDENVINSIKVAVVCSGINFSHSVILSLK